MKVDFIELDSTMPVTAAAHWNYKIAAFISFIQRTFLNCSEEFWMKNLILYLILIREMVINQMLSLN